MNETVSSILYSLKKEVIGKDRMLETMMMALLAEGHIIMEDQPGSGKSFTAEAFSKALGISKRRCQFNSDTMPTDITGFVRFDPSTGKKMINKGPVLNTNIFLADEINRTSPKTQAALLEAMEDRKVTIDGITTCLENPFILIATQNPSGDFLQGTYMLPQSQLDRFMVSIRPEKPGRETLKKLMMKDKSEDSLSRIHPLCNAQMIKEMSEKVKKVKIHDDIVDYIIDLCETVNSCEEVSQDISVRACQSLISMSKACAFIDGRVYVTPDDVKRIFAETLSHRLVLKRTDNSITSSNRRSILMKALARVKEPYTKKEGWR